MRLQPQPQAQGNHSIVIEAASLNAAFGFLFLFSGFVHNATVMQCMVLQGELIT